MLQRPVRMVSGILVLLLAAAVPVAAQSGTLQGTVSDSSGAPLPNASVSVEGTGLRATTGNNGNYEIRGVPAGTYTVRVRLIGLHGRVARRHGAGRRRDAAGLHARQGTVQLAPINVVIGSRARHTAAEELAVPVDVFPAEQLAQQGSTETSVILQSVAPSINFPRQSVTDAGDIVRPFTLRGLSPDHTLVLVNGWRRHQTALVNNFTYGMGAGSSGVDLNAFPASALDRIEVLRDGASAQYGSDAIAGVVNLVLKDGAFTPVRERRRGPLHHRQLPGRRHHGERERRLGDPAGPRLAGTLRRVPRPAADQPGLRGCVRGRGHRRDRLRSWTARSSKRNPVDQPNHHWGDGLEKDVLGFGNFRMPVNEAGTSEVYAFGGYSHRDGSGNGFRRCAVDCASFITGRNWPEIYPAGLPADDRAARLPTTRRPGGSAARWRAGTTTWARSSATTTSSTTSPTR